MTRRIEGARGQATVELLTALPIAAVVLICAWQAMLAGYAWWTASEAVRIAAREHSVALAAGASERAAKRSARKAVERALPHAFRDGSSLAIDRERNLRLSVAVPLVPPFSSVVGSGPRIAAEAGFVR